MALEEFHAPGSANDSANPEVRSNDYESITMAARAATIAAEKFKKEKADKAAAEFKAKAAKDADDLEAGRAEKKRLEDQLQEAERHITTSSDKIKMLEDQLQDAKRHIAASSDERKRLEDQLQEAERLVTTSRDGNKNLEDQLQKAEQLVTTTSAESALAKSMTDNLQLDLTTKTHELEAARTIITTLTDDSSNLNLRVSRLNEVIDQIKSDFHHCMDERDEHAQNLAYVREELSQRMSELDNRDVTVRKISWGGRDLTRDDGVCERVKSLVRNGCGIPFTNDFFGCDPQPGTRKDGAILFCRSRMVQGWEGENVASIP
jgi:chromosome segregation ATPase